MRSILPKLDAIWTDPWTGSKAIGFRNIANKPKNTAPPPIPNAADIKEVNILEKIRKIILKSDNSFGKVM